MDTSDGFGVDVRRSSAVGIGSTSRLAQIPPVDLHIPVLGQLPLPEFALGDALKTRPLEIVELDALFWDRAPGAFQRASFGNGLGWLMSVSCTE